MISKQRLIATFMAALFFGLASTSMMAQRQGVCGTSSETDDYLADLITAQKELLAQQPLQSRSTDPIYIPVRFHPVATTSGEGRVKRSDIVRQMKVLNDDFAETGFVFYFDQIDWVDLNNTVIHSMPGTAGNVIQGRKVSDAVNIFVTDVADTGSQLGGTTLGFYSRFGDYVVVRNEELEARNNTLSHEMGHFFSLPHTHRGWDAEEYDESVHGNPMSSCSAPNGEAAELADRSNCETAGDRLCDTREDYNFGFSNGQECEFTRQIMDCQGNLVEPDERNQMGYFLSCDDYHFSPQQQEMMLTNYNSADRDYLRRNIDYIPVTDTIIERVNDALPNTWDEETDSNRDVFFDWSDIEGATHYLVEFESLDSDYESYELVTESELTVEEFPAEERFFYRVFPFNETQTTVENPRAFRFLTPIATSSTNDISQLAAWEAYPNPLSVGQELTVEVDMTAAVQANVVLTGLNGQTVYSSIETLPSGQHNVMVPTDALASGLYILSLQTEDGVARQKVVIH